jgi:hypothetical protein
MSLRCIKNIFLKAEKVGRVENFETEDFCQLERGGGGLGGRWTLTNFKHKK